VKTTHFIFFAGWFTGMLSCLAVFAILNASMKEDWRIVELGTGKFVVQVQYEFLGEWRSLPLPKRHTTMQEAVDELKRIRAENEVRKVAPCTTPKPN